MTTHSNVGWFLAALTAALTLAGCAAIRVHSYQAPDADLARYRTFAWDGQVRFSTGDPRLDNNQIVREHVQVAVEQHLAKRRLERVESDAADLVLRVHAQVDQRIDSRPIDPSLASCEPDTCGPYVYDAGTLVLDFVDRRTNRLAWRGWAEGSLDAVIDDQARLERTIDDTVARILARLPR